MHRDCDTTMHVVVLKCFPRLTKTAGDLDCKSISREWSFFLEIQLNDCRICKYVFTIKRPAEPNFSDPDPIPFQLTRTEIKHCSTGTIFKSLFVQVCLVTTPSLVNKMASY